MTTLSVDRTAKTMVAPGHAFHLLRAMTRIRRLEEKCAQLYSSMKIRGFLHLYDGEEAVAVGIMEALTPDDAVVAGMLWARPFARPCKKTCLPHGRRRWPVRRVLRGDQRAARYVRPGADP